MAKYNPGKELAKHRHTTISKKAKTERDNHLARISKLGVLARHKKKLVNEMLDKDLALCDVCRINRWDSKYCNQVASLITEKEMRSINSKKRYARLKKARELGSHTQDEWEDLKKEFNCCVICLDANKKLEKDHIVPIYQGGDDSISNLQPLCKTCNTKKGPDSTNWKELRREELLTGNPKK